LTGNIATNSRNPAWQTVGVDDHRRATIVVFTCGMSAQLVERIEQVTDGPRAHPLDAIEPKRTMAKRCKGRKKTDRRAAVGSEQIGFQGRHVAASAADDERSAGVARFDCDTQPFEPIDHHARVVTIQRASQSRNAIRQGRAHQRSVRNAFRSRRSNPAADRSGDRLNFQWIRHGNKPALAADTARNQFHRL
jgi:hypothetical protein